MPVSSLTIAIPTFNRSELLQRCVESVLLDVADRPDLEGRVRVVVADDLSTSPAATATLDSLRERFSSERLKIVRLPRHTGGASTPRNTALDHVETSHVFFVDSDDYVGRGSVERLLDILDERPELDYVAVNNVSDAGRARELTIDTDFEEVDLLEAATSLSCKRIFRTSTVNELGLRFDESMTVFEDFQFTFSFLTHAKKLAYVGGHDYYHFSGHGDIDAAKEDGHLSRRDHTHGYFAYHRVADGIRFLEHSLLELSAAEIGEDVRTKVVTEVLLHRFFKVMNMQRTLGFVNNRSRQRGLFRALRTLLLSPLFGKECVAAAQETAYGTHVQTIFDDDLKGFLDA